MKKAEKKILAQEVFEYTKRHNIVAEVLPPNWVKFSVPLPPDMLFKAAQCGDELAEIYKHNNKVRGVTEDKPNE